jgi:hypothetical protein
MDRRRNFLPLAGFLVCLLAFLSYFLFFYRFPVTRDVPWANWLLFALGLGLVVAGVRRPFRQPERYRGRWTGATLALLSLVVAGFFAFATMVASRQLPPSAGAPKVGQKAPDFVLPDPAGRPVRLYDILGGTAGGTGVAGGVGHASWVVLIFYRGYW